MKWFHHQPLSADPIERAEQCADYLLRSGDLPERDATILILLELIQTYDLPIKAYRKILRIGNTQLSFRLGIFGNATAIDALLETDLDQRLVANILSNKNLHQRHMEKLDAFIDDSPKGLQNRIIYERLK